jgi:hypothetical protein
MHPFRAYKAWKDGGLKPTDSTSLILRTFLFAGHASHSGLAIGQVVAAVLGFSRLG